ncbi:hypothetical protein [Oscillibacter sp.]|uniref:hypothetical protein n=1 Tax=Oscillibacter sp. TaxID=1945593 RepID=UPI00339941BB
MADKISLTAAEMPSIFRSINGNKENISDYTCVRKLNNSSAAICITTYYDKVATIVGNNLQDNRGGININGIWYTRAGAAAMPTIEHSISGGLPKHKSCPRGSYW